MELAQRGEVAAGSGAEFCFCWLCHQWKRGTNGDINRLIRGCFLKGADFGDVDTNEVEAVRDALNRKQCKWLEFRPLRKVRYFETLHLI